MPKSPKPDAENPEWTAERFARAKRFQELPADLQRALTRKKRGPQKSPVKKLTTIRLSQDVLAALRSKGRGWQTLADETLRSAFVKER
jgi:uncharacterized protein (DUF4415 family)